MLQIINVSDFGSLNNIFYIAPTGKNPTVWPKISGERGGHKMRPSRPIDLS